MLHHFKRNHANYRSDYEVPNQKIRCNLCEKSFQTNQGLTLHLERHSSFKLLTKEKMLSLNVIFVKKLILKLII